MPQRPVEGNVMMFLEDGRVPLGQAEFRDEVSPEATSSPH
jgi:hypothetical protein